MRSFEQSATHRPLGYHHWLLLDELILNLPHVLDRPASPLGQPRFALHGAAAAALSGSMHWEEKNAQRDDASGRLGCTGILGTTSTTLSSRPLTGGIRDQAREQNMNNRNSYRRLVGDGSVNLGSGPTGCDIAPCVSGPGRVGALQPCPTEADVRSLGQRDSALACLSDAGGGLYRATSHRSALVCQDKSVV
ncbi:hypothetical protein BD289DRAFT_174995 [Coniella lustricola]|uniref:Uncharacterized protein n=1 Tax=Coniella lustricola TaxID=2025994 RepID=A0A2T3ADT9_9PEZI|nr:hypothetical protein BD289DRAFT_174995 [Coniella lustricola]